MIPGMHLFLNFPNWTEDRRSISCKRLRCNALKTQKDWGCQTLQRKEKVMKQKNTQGEEVWLVNSLFGSADTLGMSGLSHAITKPLCLALCPLKFIVPILIWFILLYSLKTICNEPKCAVLFLNTFLVFFLCLKGWKISFALELVQNLPPTLLSLDVVLEDSMFWLPASKWDPKGKHL